VIELIIEGRIAEFEQTSVLLQARLPFLASENVKQKILILSLLGFVHKSVQKKVDLTLLQEHLKLDKLQTDILVMKCLRLK